MVVSNAILFSPQIFLGKWSNLPNHWDLQPKTWNTFDLRILLNSRWFNHHQAAVDSWGLCRRSFHSFSWSCYRSCTGEMGWSGVFRTPQIRESHVVLVISGAHPQDEPRQPPRCQVTSDFLGWDKKNEAFRLHWIIAVRTDAMSAKNSLSTWVSSWDITNIGSRIRY